MNLLVVIVCYRATELTIECLRSLGSEIRAIPEAKVAGLRERDGRRLRADAGRHHRRRGVGRLGLADSDPPQPRLQRLATTSSFAKRWPWTSSRGTSSLLNSDTIVRPGALAQLLAAAEQHPHAGIIGPRLEWPDGTPQVSCFHHVNPVGELLDAASTGPLSRLLRRYEVSVPVSNETIEVDWTSFACALIRRGSHAGRRRTR